MERRAVTVLCFVLVSLFCAVANASWSRSELMQISSLSVLDPSCNDPGVQPYPTLFPNSEVEPIIAINPTNRRNLVVGWQADRSEWFGSHGHGIAYSRDGGNSWQQTFVPGLSWCSGGTEFRRTGDTVLTFAANGDLFMSAIVMNPNDDNSGMISTSAVSVSKSSDGGATWGNPVFIGAENFQDPLSPSGVDKEDIVADPYNSTRVYLSWGRVLGDYVTAQTMFSRTTDGGATWEPVRVIFSQEIVYTINPKILVLPNNRLVIVVEYYDVDGVHKAGVLRSNDAGQTWSSLEYVNTVQQGHVFDPDTGAWVMAGSLAATVDKKTEIFISYGKTLVSALASTTALHSLSLPMAAQPGVNLFR